MTKEFRLLARYKITSLPGLVLFRNKKKVQYTGTISYRVAAPRIFTLAAKALNGYLSGRERTHTETDPVTVMKFLFLNVSTTYYYFSLLSQG